MDSLYDWARVRQESVDNAYEADMDLRRGAKLNEAMHDREDAWEDLHKLVEEVSEKLGDTQSN